MSVASGDSGTSNRNAHVDLDICLEEISGWPEGDTNMYQFLWRRGTNSKGETHWKQPENGVVKWKQNFSIRDQYLPRLSPEQDPNSKHRKFLDLALYYKETMDETPKELRNLRVDLYFQHEKRKKANLQFTIQFNGADLKLKLIISVQMKELLGRIGGGAAEDLPAPIQRNDSKKGRLLQEVSSRLNVEDTNNNFNTAVNNIVNDRKRLSTTMNDMEMQMNNFQFGGPQTPTTIPPAAAFPSKGTFAPDYPPFDDAASLTMQQIPKTGRSYPQETTRNNMMTGTMQNGGPVPPSLENMKVNVLKLYSKIQEQEGLLSEKKREVRDIRSAYGNLRNDYDYLRKDLDDAELRAHKLKQDLIREQKLNADLQELKRKLDGIDNNSSSGEDKRNCVDDCIIS